MSDNYDNSEEDLRCMRCEQEAKSVITLTNFVPYYIEKYGYCPEHTPETDEDDPIELSPISDEAPAEALKQLAVAVEFDPQESETFIGSVLASVC